MEAEFPSSNQSLGRVHGLMAASVVRDGTQSLNASFEPRLLLLEEQEVLGGWSS